MGAVLAAFRLRDALDILLVAAVLYAVLTTFSATRAIQLVVGLVGLLAASFLARQMELASLGWLLDNFWSFWVLALVVLFQPELRRVLTRMGESRVLRGMGRAGGKERTHVIQEVLKAADALAGRRVGALIVLERATALDGYAELGVPLDALVSADLLVSLFQPYSPLHDGAALIREDRVVAVGCFLPLSRNAQLGRTLGTRHRAALGLAEESDALVLAISEETGRISLAVSGRIETPVDREALGRRLAELLAPTEARASRRWARRVPVRSWLRR